MILVVLHINTYLQPSTFCTNLYKYDLSFYFYFYFLDFLQTHVHYLNLLWINNILLVVTCPNEPVPLQKKGRKYNQR